jgi:hypothetical protein
MAKEETVIRFRYLANIDKERYITAWIKVTDPSVNAKNALAYLVTRYPERQNIEIIEIISRVKP